MCDKDVVRGDDVVDRPLADEDIVGAEEHENDIGRVLVEPARQLTVLDNVGGLESGVTFVILVDVGPTAGALLATDKVEVRHTCIPKLGLEVCAPASLEYESVDANLK